MAMPFKLKLDPGHGGSDPGAVGNGLREKDLVLTISKYARDYILANYKNIEVSLTRETDTFVSLSNRAKQANDWGADGFVSVHNNAFTGKAHGYEDFIYNGKVSNKTQQLQDDVHSEVSQEFSYDRGKKQANFAVLRLTNMPALLTENGFIDNTADANYLKKDSNLKELGKAHAIGIAKFFGLETGSSKTTSTKTASKPKTSSTKSSKTSGVLGLVDWMKAQKMDSSFSNRKKLAGQHGISNYRGAANQNTQLLNKLKGASGKPASTSSSSRSLPNTRYWVKSPASARFSGSGVRKVQEALASVYYYPNKGAKNNGVDGWYGPDTADAVKRFQSMHGLTADGIYGPDTRSKLMEVSPLY